MTENKDFLDVNIDETINETPSDVTDTKNISADTDEKSEDILPISTDDDTNPSNENNNEYDEEDDDEDDEDYSENPIFAKLAKLPPKKAKTFQIIYGICCGAICYAALLLEEFFPRIDQLVKYCVWGVLIVVLFLSFTIGKKTKWDMIPYRLSLAGGILAGIAIHIIVMAINGDPIF